ncbi:MAG: DUF1844 domain-containing protein [Candidatus Eisenbacteria bacterium]|nr:DUF1844 domain-containing protein [Candidatus Eisenbacteria bacterium]
MSDATRPGRQSALFLQLVLGLQQSGMMALGKLLNPISRKIEVHLEMARDTIDTLAALEARTQSRLEPDEARVLRQALTDLRMNYVEELKKAGGKSAAADSQGAAADSQGAAADSQGAAVRSPEAPRT